MRFWSIIGLCAAALAAAVPTGGGDGEAPTDAQRAEAIREAFLHSWNGYKKYAWGADELLSVTKSGGNSRNGWGASIADALSTAVLMELQDVVLEALEYLATVDFTTTETEVSLFETTIRYLGGLLSGYDLLKGPYSYLIPKNCEPLIDALLQQAVILADRLSFAFETPTGIPYNVLNLRTNTSTSTTNSLATAGTLVLEWTHLSDLTGNNTYATLAQRAESYLINPVPSLGEPFPGLLGSDIDIVTGRFLNSCGGWSGGTDSFYEYLLKMYIYSPSRFYPYLQRWLSAAESTLRHLLLPEKHSFVAEYDGATTLRNSQGHLTCFIGGNLALGGELLGRDDLKAAGLALTKGCHDTYAATACGIGPERWSWDASRVPPHLRGFYQKHGFYPTISSYNLRPEVVESYYHAYKLTGEDKYKDWAWDAFRAIDKACRTPCGYSGVTNVMRHDGGVKMNFQESFWFAEVLKYLWLTFAQKEVGVGRGRNQWVFNTEAHPLKVAES